MRAACTIIIIRIKKKREGNRKILRKKNFQFSLNAIERSDDDNGGGKMIFDGRK